MCGTRCSTAQALGHPLIPAAVNVRNTVRLLGEGRGDGPRALVVSGSNMSGKSTLLRTVGVNAVLALAGAPVRASRLTLTPLAIGATLRVQDSLQGGTSRFYAEITRLRHIVDETNGPLPPLFLLDEMLNGTNSRDRGAGAEALIKGLVARGAIGLVTTHDLALSSLADAMAPLAANVHFEDHLEARRDEVRLRLPPRRDDAQQRARAHAGGGAAGVGRLAASGFRLPASGFRLQASGFRNVPLRFSTSGSG